MDLMDFEGEQLYFEEYLPPEVEALLQRASDLYGDGEAEPPLLEAARRAPESLNVLVAMYRYYYYQHRLEDALAVARLALSITARRLGLPLDWNLLTVGQLGQAGPSGMALVRFHLLSLKAMAYLQLRLGRPAEGKAILEKLLELDSHNRLGAKQLLEVAEIVES
jgi:tetratricopeptide (TPR) repeat protein